MNYHRLYESIIENAKQHVNERKGIYTEKHHIIPRSLGGENTKDNLVRLTAREHFICHWMLVKMQDKGSDERSKMLHAFWMMKACPCEENVRYINSRVYEKYKEEYSSICRLKQTGSGNSNFGRKWYTNIDTGESKVFLNDPNETWVLGRNVLGGQSCSIKSVILKHKNGSDNPNFGKSWFTNTNDGTSKCFYDKPSEDWIEGRNVLNGQSCSIKHIYKKKSQISVARERCDRFHSGNWKSLSDFDKSEGRSKMASVQMFKTNIPIYLSYVKSKRRRFVSDRSLIGVYE